MNHSESFARLERQKIFSHEWICVGRADELPGHGDYLTHDVAGVSVLMIRQESGAIAAFVNACAHRFACLMPKACGTAKRLTCRYHAWSYGTDGCLLRAPYMEMKEGFDASEHRLRELHCEVWQGFVYVCLAERPDVSLSSALAPLSEQVVGRFDMGLSLIHI